ncbi:MAG: ABC transporter ATP-binding protein [Planctomycetaceae bacterium]|nr:ABC transporter ATP-binding protein [Planctomycetaceae bacterium]
MTTGTDHAFALDLHAVSRVFGAVAAVEDVDLAVPARSFTALVGPSGCGKTTLLRMMGGLDAPSSGSLARAEGATGFCFQEPRLLPWRTLLENVALPLELAGVAATERRARALDALALVRLADASSRFPHQLSGGMKMRASIARALVSRPRLLLLDEPFGALDEVTRHELDLELRALWERERFTAVIVTHSMPEAVFLADRVVVFSPRPARIVADIATPALPRGERFWTDPALGACVREASDAMLAAIAEASR